MPKKVIQVPIGDELLEALDDLSRAEGRSRSEIIREACQRYLERLEQVQLDRSYQEGYRRRPEDPALAEAQASVTGEVLSRESW